MKNSRYPVFRHVAFVGLGPILSAALLLCLLGCQATPPQDSSPVIPQPPDETVVARLMYSPDPTFIDAAGFEQSLTELSDQVTLLYILAPNQPLPAGDLEAVTLMQKRFYRYGLRVMLLDRNSSEHWTDLKNQLESAGANFPVAYPGNSSGDWLVCSLQITDVSDNQLYMIDAGSLRTKVPRPWTPMRLSQTIKQILTSRSSSNVRPR